MTHSSLALQTLNLSFGDFCFNLTLPCSFALLLLLSPLLVSLFVILPKKLQIWREKGGRGERESG